MAGALALMMGSGASGGSASASITNQTINSIQLSTATAGYRLNSAGTAQRLVQASYTTLETWLVSGTASQFEVRVTPTGDALSTGTTGSWLALSSDREWTLVQASVAAKSTSLLVEIRNASSGAVLDSATVTLYAERTV